MKYKMGVRIMKSKVVVRVSIPEGYSVIGRDAEDCCIVEAQPPTFQGRKQMKYKMVAQVAFPRGYSYRTTKPGHTYVVEVWQPPAGPTYFWKRSIK